MLIKGRKIRAIECGHIWKRNKDHDPHVHLWVLTGDLGLKRGQEVCFIGKQSRQDVSKHRKFLSLLQSSLTCYQNGVTSLPGSGSQSFLALSMRFLGKFQNLGVYCINNLIAKGKDGVVLEYLHSCQDSGYLILLPPLLECCYRCALPCPSKL